MHDDSTREVSEPQADTAECPACRSRQIDDSIPTVDPICSECGAVITADFDAVIDIDEPKQQEEVTWTDHYTVQNSTEQQVATAFEFLEELSDRLSVPTEIRKRAAERYGEAAIEKTTDGRPTETVVAGVLTIAGRELGRPHPVGRVAEVADIEVRELRRALSALRRDLLLETVCQPEAYLVELSPLLGVDSSTTADAKRILSGIPNHHIGGKHPAAVAGAALYVSADGEITQREVAQATGVTTETVRLRVKECRRNTDSNVPQDDLRRE